MEWKYCPACGRQMILKNGLPACPNGHYTHYDNPVPAATAFLRKDDKYLLLKRNKEPQRGAWHIPGGFMNPGETPEEAIVREVKEETGLGCKIVSLIGINPSRYGNEKHSLAICFLAEAVGESVLLFSRALRF